MCEACCLPVTQKIMAERAIASRDAEGGNRSQGEEHDTRRLGHGRHGQGDIRGP